MEGNDKYPRAYVLGQEAYRQGLNLIDNPYKRAWRTTWSEGWLAAARLRQSPIDRQAQKTDDAGANQV